ncbi:MAG: Bax inhibitor-1/YccA family protein [Candidatus Orphnella occulta]|nr:Bax inhibitor-1/YccA family protein [Candidatus Orphnella occulta]MDP8296634.1 Bax inhibitor-1/YccA family protein [Candidatus Orphnella occulta]
MLRSGNPALRGDAFTRQGTDSSAGTMTIAGTANKTILLLIIAFITASLVWSHQQASAMLLFPSLIIGLIIAMVTIFKKEYSPITAPLYAAVEGVLLGTISSYFNAQYPGIVIQAVALTFAVLLCMLGAYRSGLIKVTERFKLGVVAATGGIMVVYLVSMVMSFFGANIGFIHSNGLLGIGFSVFVIIIASLNLVLDFDLIEKGADVGAPKYMEWYGAFALIVTLVWLYLEILRLLAKLRR